eukprot:TRINITY_DN8280_c0_g1_i1.p1 TRINITY_DN8280_c0_g1~~TRINITY_DN8280_c0_g1_i1.p1  ORF type:complete len:386 (+),score=33.04 TRINITY_DN8280_c0_g1_i1:49-1206(+)
MPIEYLAQDGKVLEYLMEAPAKGDNVRLVCVSDTHLGQDKVILPEGDILLHCGDILMQSTLMSKEKIRVGFEKFLSWMGKQTHQHKIFILGNHDAALMDLGYDYITSKCPPGVTYLQNTSITVQGIKIWGTPHSVGSSSNYAFQHRSAKGLWDSMPSDTQIIMSHGPAKCIGGDHLSKTTEFIRKIEKSKSVKLHVCGHLHWAFGMQSILRHDGVVVPTIVCSSLDGSYNLSHKPVVVDFSGSSQPISKKKCLFLVANEDHVGAGQLIADLVNPYYDVFSLGYHKRMPGPLPEADAVVCLGISATKVAAKYPSNVAKVVYSHTGRSNPDGLHSDFGIHMLAAAKDEQSIVAFLNASFDGDKPMCLRLSHRVSLRHPSIKSVCVKK